MKPIQSPAASARNCSTLARQGGATLIISLIILVLMTLLAVSSFNLGKGNLQIVGNMQRQSEALAAAQEAVEEATSTTRLFDNPTGVFLAPCAANAKCVDTNGDGTPDVTVTLTPAPACVKAATVKNTSLDLTNSEDAGCSVGAAQSFGIAGATTGDSLCADSVWEINAVAVDNQTQSTVTVTQGMSVRVSTDNIATSCP